MAITRRELEELRLWEESVPPAPWMVRTEVDADGVEWPVEIVTVDATLERYPDFTPGKLYPHVIADLREADLTVEQARLFVELRNRLKDLLALADKVVA